MSALLLFAFAFLGDYERESVGGDACSDCPLRAQSFVGEAMSSNRATEPKEGSTMTTTPITRRTELAHRTSDDVDVYLFWNRRGNHVTVSVFDARTDDRFELEVDGRHALDAFNHPYAYAASAREDRVSALIDALAA